MSPLEFFAELYALYYDLDDPKRSAIPADVGKWLEKNVGQPDSGAPMPAKASRKRRHETIERPKNAIK
jgi:hypothetical protein